MSLFCLVHGSTQDSSCWDLLIPELGRLGHQCVAVDLPANTPEASGVAYAERIVSALPEDARDALVVAHSVSGIFLPLAAVRRQVRGMVFLAAAIPRIGFSLIEQVKAGAEMFHADWLGKDPAKDDGLAMQFLFHDCAPHIVPWALKTRRLMFAKGALIEKCPLAEWPNAPSSYIVCQDDRTFRPEWSRRAARELLGVRALELPGGHCPQVSRPVELAAMLAQLARSE